MCLNQDKLPFIVGALEVLTLENIWPPGSDDLLANLDLLIATLCLPPDSCGVIAGSNQPFFAGSGQPACGPQIFTVFNFGCTAAYNATDDRIDACQASGNGHTTFEAVLDLSGTSGVTVTRIQARYETNTTRTPGSGAPDDHFISVGGSTLAYHGIPATWSGVDNFTLDTGLVSLASPVIHIHGEARVNPPTDGAGYDRLVALAITWNGVNPWAC